MAAKLKYKVHEISFSTNSDVKSINELKTSIAYENKSTNIAIRKLVSLAKNGLSSAETGLQGCSTPKEEHVLTVKS